jgi:hypothetical protein
MQKSIFYNQPKQIKMKKQVLARFLVVLLLAFSSSMKAQDVKGVNFINAGIGVGTYGFVGTGGLPITASFEHGFSKNISAGLNLGFIQRKYADDWKYTYLVFGARGSYHFNEVLNVQNEKLDVYGGISLNYRHYKIKYGHDIDDYYGSASGGEVDFGIHAGGRYLFSPKVGAFAELGYGISPLELGITFKL